MTSILAALAAVIATAVLALLVQRAAYLPQAALTARSLHLTPVPRVGGLAIWAGVLPAMAFTAVGAPAQALGWIPAWIALLLVSLYDDVRGVGITTRLGTHFACAAWFAWWIAPAASGDALAGALQMIVVVLVVAWAANLYNFMDGSDGLAALMTILGFAAYGAAGIEGSASSVMAFAIAAATLPLLVVNRPPARMFMGDAGAVPLGFLAAVLGILGVVSHTWAAWFPVLVFLPFIADASLTLVRRAWRRERWWEGHRSHYYQRLHQLGAGHAGTLAVYAALIAGTSVTAVACTRIAPEWGVRVLLVWCAVLLLPFAAIDYHWRRRSIRNP